MVAPRKLALLTTLGFIVVGLAGCIGGPGAPPPDEKRIATAEITVELGGIEGVVVDPTYSPLIGATVTIRDIEKATQTVEDGSFAFSKVAPGTYALVAVYPGHESVARSVSVSAGKIEKVEFMLPPLGSTAPFIDKLEFAGFQECAVMAGMDGSGTPAEVLGENFAGISVCSYPNGFASIVLGGNVTNDHFMDRFFLGKDVKSVVVEMTWESSGATGRSMSLLIEPDGIFSDPEVTYGEATGASPIRIGFDLDRLRQVDENMTRICKDGYDRYCGEDKRGEEGRNVTGLGGALQWRVFPHWATSDSDKAGASATLQQRFTIYVSVFYHEPAPSGYSITRS